MAKNKEQKTAIIKKIQDALGDMKSVIFANFDNLSVKEADKLRNECRQNNVQVVVAKKSLLKKALHDAKLGEEAVRNLTGGVASFFSFGDEIIGAALIHKFAKTNEGLKMLGGIVGGAHYDSLQVNKLATIPSRSELMARAVGSLNSPLTGLVGVLTGNMRGLVGVLTAIKDKK